VSYGIALSDEARHDLAKLPIPVRRRVFQHLEALGEYPTALSRRSHFPYREKCQISPFSWDHENIRWEINVLFQYGQDEQTIHVICIGHSSLPVNEAERRDPPKDP
jgi:hypothetical protein